MLSIDDIIYDVSELLVGNTLFNVVVISIYGFDPWNQPFKLKFIDEIIICLHSECSNQEK